jgi:hypothetical protein
MKIPINDKKFVLCPEYKGRAVCVDVTPLKQYQTSYGPKDKFKLALEVDLLRENGSRFAVWSKPFTPSNHERSAFASLMKDWNGRPLTREEWEKFDTEDLIGRAAEITVVHEHVEGEVYANLKLIGPDRSDNPLKPSGKFIRAKDRSAKTSTYQQVQQPDNNCDRDYLSVKVHVGRFKGLELRDLAQEALKDLINNWSPTAKTNPRQSAEDKQLIAALERWSNEQDDLPY